MSFWCVQPTASITFWFPSPATLVPLPESVRTPAVTSALVSPAPIKKLHSMEDSAPPAKKPKMEAGKPAQVSPVVTPEKKAPAVEKSEKSQATAKGEKGGKKKKDEGAAGGASGKAAGWWVI